MPLRVPGVPRNKFRDLLVRVCGGCSIQHTGWPCGTCFMAAGFTNDDWQAVLAWRGDYGKDWEIDRKTAKIVTDIVFDENGKFVRHEYGSRPYAEMRETIRELWHKLGGC